jgi:hypothetical protein
LIATRIPHVRNRNRNRIVASFSQWLCGKVRAFEDVFGWGLQVQMMQIKRLRVKGFRSRRVRRNRARRIGK